MAQHTRRLSVKMKEKPDWIKPSNSITLTLHRKDIIQMAEAFASARTANADSATLEITFIDGLDCVLELF